jgi:hypothetical protein
MKKVMHCYDDARREAVRAKPELNGLDYVEVSDDQRSLTVYFLGKAPQAIKKGRTEYFRIEGGLRIRNIRVTGVDVVRETDPELDDYVTVQVDKPGDFSTYTLRLVGLKNIDPFYDHVEFSFKVNCPGDLDCAPVKTCPPEPLPEPEINYLAKDYASFRQLILDRLALIMPDWKERHVPDLGITLVELLAYVGDYLSYYQDSAATEAYLDTARQRISVRRHVRLVDYVLHEGCNARAWVCVDTDTDLAGDKALKPQNLFFITSVRDVAGIDRTILNANELRNVPKNAYEIFEAIGDRPIELLAARSRIRFYTWGERECCLPRGATSATLIDGPDTPPVDAVKGEQKQQKTSPGSPSASIPGKLNLRPGDVLIFEEVLGPRSGLEADADPAHRHAVCLTRAEPGVDPLNGQPVIEIEWALEDALPFPLCLSVMTDADHGCLYHEDITIARGNVIRVDQGLTIEPFEELGTVPAAATEAKCFCEGRPSDVRLVSGRFRPRLKAASLTFRESLPIEDPGEGILVPASGFMRQDVRRALPQISLTGILSVPDEAYWPVAWNEINEHGDLAAGLIKAGFSPDRYEKGVPLSPKLYAEYRNALKAKTNSDELLRLLIDDISARSFRWSPRVDLLGSGPDDRHFVVEIDNDGVAWLRFGDDECGQMPEAESLFFAAYRVGTGSEGNVGAESITHLVFRRNPVSGVAMTVRNPLPASGGTDAEPMAEAKLFAPTAFRNALMRGITAGDYALLAKRGFESRVQAAAAALAWTGSWYEADVAIDPKESEELPESLREQIEGRLEHCRRIGHDQEVEQARYVPVELVLRVRVLPNYLRGHVKAALLDVFSNRGLPGGRLGFFHPDRLTFGEGLYVSQIVAAAQAVQGVESVRVTKLNRLFEQPNRELENGVLPLGPLEVARLDNDPSFPEHGIFTLILCGGR